MIEIIIKGWDKIGITKTFLPTFQLATREINIATPLFKEPTNEKVVEEANIDIDPTNANVNNCWKLPLSDTTNHMCKAIKIKTKDVCTS